MCPTYDLKLLSVVGIEFKNNANYSSGFQYFWHQGPMLL